MTTNNQTILQSILNDVKSIKWSTLTVENKAIEFTAKLFDVFTYKFKSYDIFMPMSQEYWKSLIKGKTDHLHEIKRALVIKGILMEQSGLYKKDKRVLSYKFNTTYIYNYTEQSDIIILAYPFFNKLITNEFTELEMAAQTDIKKLKVERGMHWGYALDTIVNEQVDKGYALGVCIGGMHPSHIDLNISGKIYRYGIDKAIKFANEMNQVIVSYKNKYFLVESLEAFKIYKKNELKLLYSKQLFDIENGIIYAKRNDTNNRLDSNLTNLKSELWEYLQLDGETLEELDVANMQFSLATFINTNVDILFIEKAQSGTLYAFISEEFNITQKEAKNLMFRLAFDKVKNTDEFNKLRTIFPKLMEWVDTYKKENGYKAFSNLLQDTESRLMIDGVYQHLYNMNYVVYTIHDAIRVKQSQAQEVKKIIEAYFKEINFKCLLRDKNENTVKEPKEEVVTATVNEAKIDRPKKRILSTVYMNIINEVIMKMDILTDDQKKTMFYDKWDYVNKLYDMQSNDTKLIYLLKIIKRIVLYLIYNNKYKRI